MPLKDPPTLGTRRTTISLVAMGLRATISTLSTRYRPYLNRLILPFYSPHFACLFFPCNATCFVRQQPSGDGSTFRKLQEWQSSTIGLFGSHGAARIAGSAMTWDQYMRLSGVSEATAPWVARRVSNDYWGATHAMRGESAYPSLGAMFDAQVCPR